MRENQTCPHKIFGTMCDILKCKKIMLLVRYNFGSLKMFALLHLPVIL